MRAPARDDLIDAALASLAAGMHLALAAYVERFPPQADFSLVFVAVPVIAASVAALALLLGERRPLQVAGVYAWLVAIFTLPAGGLGLAWVPSALVLTFALQRPRLSSGRQVAG